MVKRIFFFWNFQSKTNSQIQWNIWCWQQWMLHLKFNRYKWQNYIHRGWVFAIINYLSCNWHNSKKEKQFYLIHILLLKLLTKLSSSTLYYEGFKHYFPFFHPCASFVLLLLLTKVQILFIGKHESSILLNFMFHNSK